MNPIVVLGLAAGACTTFAGLPQLIRALTTRSTRDLSILALLMLDVGVLLWIAYGALIGSLPLVIANIVSFLIYLPLTVVWFVQRATRWRRASS